MLEMSNKIDYGYDDLDEAFPPVDANFEPAGYRVLFQLRTPKRKTRGGIILTDEARETDQWNTQVAKVIKVGPTAFHDRDSGKPWIEGPWARVGDFVRVPKYGGDRFSIKCGDDAEVLFVVFRDADISGKVSNPLDVVAYI